MKRYDVLLTFLVAIHSFTVSSIEDYPTPKDCLAFYVADRIGVALECQVPAIGTEASGFEMDFSVVPSKNALSLMVVCTFTAWSVESSFESISLKHLKELKELIFTKCDFYSLPNDTFEGQYDTLNYLTLNRNANKYEVPFVVRSGSLQHLTQLRSLDLADTNLIELPTNELCPLTNLESLYLSSNRMKDTQSLGFASENEETCGISLRILDLSFNELTVIRNETFAKLINLQFLLLKGNQLTELDTMAFSYLTSMISLDLSQNLLKSIAENLFADSGRSLLVLNMSSNAIEGTLAETAFEHLNKLIVLDLSYNAIETIEAVNRLTHLMELYVRSNKLVAIGDDTFSKLSDLIALDLSNNTIEVLNRTNLNGLTGLTILRLNDNNVKTLEHDLFECCLEVTNLNVSNNGLSEMPRINNLKNLQILDFSYNQIRNLDNDTFEGLIHLEGISLKSNLLVLFTDDVFVGLRSLKVLNLGLNRIFTLRTRLLERNTNLTNLYLYDNLLRELPNFQTLEELQYLDVSQNLLTKLDYGFLPKNLTYLYIHNNQLRAIEDRFDTSKQTKITVLMASNNQLTSINRNSLPPTMKIVDLSNNNLSYIQTGTFESMTDLELIDISYNNLQAFEKDALLVNRSPTLKRPRMFLAGNFVKCDCTMNWLKHINEDSTHRASTFVKLYTTVTDLGFVFCWTPIIGSSIRGVSLIINVADDRFICQFDEHEFSDQFCHTKITNRKVCKLVCPNRCSCYNDKTWNNVVVYCSDTNQTTVPLNIPVLVKTLYLDGNHILKLTNGSFDVLLSVESLYLNGTGLRTIERDSFVGMTSLKELHLEKNELRELTKGTFNGLTRLSVLDLSSNELVLIEEEVFEPLKSLDTLKLNSNRLTNFPVWTLTIVKAMPSLAKMSLSSNPWSCECHYLESYRRWLQSYADKVIDMDRLFCKPEGDNNETLIPMIAFNASYCFNATYVEQTRFVRYIPTLIGVTLSFIAICVISVLVFVYHKEMQVLIYSRYGVRLFHRNEENHDDEKPYDAFVSYSNLDEDFLVTEFLPKLERIEFPYHLCLHHRNFMPGAYIMDSILQAVATSKRTILLLSENFIRSEWCRLEFKSAHHQMLQDRCNRVIVVVLGKIPDNLDPEMKLYMKTNTYLQWSDNLFWQKLYFALPDVPRRQAEN